MAAGTVLHARAPGLLEPSRDPDAAADAVIASPDLLGALLAGLESRVAAERFHSGKVLVALARRSPETLVPQLAAVLRLLDSPNQVLQSLALRALGHVARADARGRITRSLPRLLAPLAGPHLVVANNAIEAVARVAAARPQLTERVVAALLAVPAGSWRTPDCRRIVARRAAVALRALQGNSSRQPEIQAFLAAYDATAAGRTRRSRP